MMKNFFYTTIKGLAILVIIGCWGCQDEDSFLDKKVSASLNEQIVFADSAYTMDYLTAIYEGLYFWYNTGSSATATNGSWSEITDECETKWPGGHNVPNQVFDGTFGEPFYNRIAKLWSHFYTRIRQCNIYLENVNEESPLSNALKARTKAEIRFLRSYHYFLPKIGRASCRE